MIKMKNILFGIYLVLVLTIFVNFANISNNTVSDLMVDFNSTNNNVNYSYDDTILVVNKNSQDSKNIGNYFRMRRNISDSKIVYIDTIDGEEISLENFNSQIRNPIKNFLISKNLTNKINYIITTKGVPLKITDNPGRSVDSELTLILGPYNDAMGVKEKIYNPYFAKNETFSRSKYGIYLVTRLTGYNYTDVKNLIDKSSNTTNNGTFVFDITPKGGGYQIFNNEMINAAKILEEKGYNVILDNTTTFLTNQSNVLGYVSWGSNDPDAKNNAKTYNTWVPGAIVETAVSSSGRTFTYPPRYGQSLIADLIAEGVTGAKGYVSEPYIDAIAHPDILFSRYTNGYNLAESYYMASRYVGWNDVVVGDPKTVIRCYMQFLLIYVFIFSKD